MMLRGRNAERLFVLQIQHVVVPPRWQTRVISSGSCGRAEPLGRTAQGDRPAAPTSEIMDPQQTAASFGAGLALLEAVQTYIRPEIGRPLAALPRGGCWRRRISTLMTHLGLERSDLLCRETSGHCVAAMAVGLSTDGAATSPAANTALP